MKAMTDFIFLGFRITADGDCSHEIKTLAPWEKIYTKFDNILKSRDITLPTMVHLVKAMVFPVVWSSGGTAPARPRWPERKSISSDSVSFD